MLKDCESKTPRRNKQDSLIYWIGCRKGLEWHDVQKEVDCQNQCLWHFSSGDKESLTPEQHMDIATCIHACEIGFNLRKRNGYA